jgi:DNA mismatch repair ATPase MutS
MQTKTTMAQPSLFAEDNHVILQELSQTNIDSLTPKEALLLLYRWKEMQ